MSLVSGCYPVMPHRQTYPCNVDHHYQHQLYHDYYRHQHHPHQHMTTSSTSPHDDGSAGGFYSAAQSTSATASSSSSSSDECFRNRYVVDSSAVLHRRETPNEASYTTTTSSRSPASSETTTSAASTDDSSYFRDGVGGGGVGPTWSAFESSCRVGSGRGGGIDEHVSTIQDPMADRVLVSHNFNAVVDIWGNISTSGSAAAAASGSVYGSTTTDYCSAAAGVDATGVCGTSPVFGVVRCTRRRVSANRKERRRTYSINSAFSALRGSIPNVPTDTKLSKIKTLRLATSYIAYLMDVLNKDDPKLAAGGFKAEIKRKIESREEKRKRETEVDNFFLLT